MLWSRMLLATSLVVLREAGGFQQQLQRRMLRRLWSARSETVAGKRIQEDVKAGALVPMSFTVDGELRARLRLAGRQKRARIFVEKGASEDAIREAIAVVAPPLRHVEYSLEKSEESNGQRTKLRVVAASNDLPSHVAKSRKNASYAQDEDYQMLSWYAFFDPSLPRVVEAEESGWDVERTTAALTSAWEPMRVVGRAYVAPEGVNAQLAVPTREMDKYMAHHEKFFEDLRRDGISLSEKNIDVPMLNLDEIVPGDEPKKPFRSLHVRTKDQVVSDGESESSLDLSDCGREVDAAEWHEKLGGDYSADPSPKKDLLVLDCRNHYESEAGSFAGSVPLDTETFKEAYRKIEEALEDKPKDAEVAMFCTGGIRCVKAGAFVKSLGFDNVTRLKGGVVSYARYLKENNTTLSSASRFRGVNYVFNDRMGERITEDTPRTTTDSSSPLDSRAAEAIARSRRDEDVDGTLEGYAEKLSGEEDPLLVRVRLDAEARYPSAAHMVCGPTQGRLLAMMCKMIGAERVLELGCFVGYGALWLSSALPSSDRGGKVVTVDRDARVVELARSHFADKNPEWADIDVVEKDTSEFLAQDLLEFEEPFDLLYLDADKKGYARALDAVLAAGKLKSPGGIVVADNTLWKGKLAKSFGGNEMVFSGSGIDEEQRAAEDARSRELQRNASASAQDLEKIGRLAAKAFRRDRSIQQSMHEFNIKLRKDPRFELVVLPLRDGITVARLVE